MPKLKDTNKYAALNRLLKGYDLAPHAGKMADVLGCCGNTAMRRVKDHGLLTLDDLRKIRQRGHVPKDELIEAIREAI